MPISTTAADEAAETVWWAIEVFKDRWFVHVLHRLLDRPKRQAELLREIDGVSQRMLTRTLRHMERDGLISRRLVKAKPLHVEYDLTELGHSLKPVLVTTLQWARAHRAAVESSRTRSPR